MATTEADARAQAVLETIARQAGFHHVVFVPEPIAAAWHYEQTVQAEELVLIADIGGGTSDFSVVRIGPQRRGRIDRAEDILATAGVRMGGTDFDSALSLAAVMPLLGLGTRLVEKDLPMPNALYHELATWPTINFAYTYKNEREVGALVPEAGEPEKVGRLLTVIDKRLGHRVAFAVEDAKIALSAERDAAVALDFLEAASPSRRRAAVSRGRSPKTDRLYRRPATASPRRARRDSDRHRLSHRRLEPRAGRARGDCAGGTGGTVGHGLGFAVRCVGMTQMAGRADKWSFSSPVIRGRRGELRGRCMKLMI